MAFSAHSLASSTEANSPIWVTVNFSGCIEGVATVAVNLRDDFSVPF